MKNFGSVLLSLFVCISTAHADPTPSRIHEVASTIAAMFKPRMTALDRETMTFHYMNEDEEPKISSTQQIADWAGWLGEQFWNLDAVTGDAEGAGFYVATDPRASRSFAGQRPLLFATPIKKGAMILDLMSEHPDDDANFETLKNLISEFQCMASHHSYEMYNLEAVTQAFRNSDSLACRQVITEAYRQIGAEAILYTYTSNIFASGCRFRQDAFNIIDRNAINENGTALFWNSGSFANKTLARMISQNYQDSHDDFISRYGEVFSNSSKDMPGSLKGLSTFERSARSWRKRNLLRCGSAWSIEGRESMTSKLIESMKASFTDFEVQDALIDWHLAYGKRVQNQFYDLAAPQRIAAVERLVYLQTGLAKDFSQLALWQKAYDLYFSNSMTTDSIRDAEAGALLGETAPRIDTADLLAFAKKILASIYDPRHPQPGLYGDVLRHLGFGPLLIRLKITQNVGYLGGFPALMTVVPADASVDGVADFAKNKSAFLSILRPCTAMMNDPSVSLATLQASECAVRQPPH